MQKIAIYPTIIENPSVCNEDTVFEYLRLIDDIQVHDSIIIPDEFYTGDITNFIWCNQNNNLQSLIDYFIEVILKGKKTQKSYSDIFSCINKPISSTCDAITGMHGNKYIEIDELFVENFHDVYEVKVFYLSLIADFTNFEVMSRVVFKNLAFLDNSFKDISDMGNSQETKVEIVRHLDKLNRYAHAFYNELNRDAKLTMAKLNSLFSLNCTGVGSNQNSSGFRLNDTYKGISVSPRCNAHTKLFDRRNDYRIYFSWENLDIVEEKIIIGSVGGHIEA
jgi:hypothetical protein